MEREKSQNAGMAGRMYQCMERYVGLVWWTAIVGAKAGAVGRHSLWKMVLGDKNLRTCCWTRKSGMRTRTGSKRTRTSSKRRSWTGGDERCWWLEMEQCGTQNDALSDAQLLQVQKQVQVQV